MDHFYQQKLINEKNDLQRQLVEAERKLKSLTEQVGDYERLVSLLKNQTHQPGFRGEFDNARYPAVERMLLKRKRYPVLGPNERPLTNFNLHGPRGKQPGGMRKLRYDVKPPKDASNTIEESAAERANDAGLARLQRKSGIDLGVRTPHREGEGVTPAGEAAQQRRMGQQGKVISNLDKPARPQYYIKGTEGQFRS